MFKPSIATEDLDHVLRHTQDLWADLRGERIFITGGSGFFATWIIESFLRANELLGLGARAVVLTRDAAAYVRRRPHMVESPDLEIWQGQIDQFESPPGRFACIIHAATETHQASHAIDRLKAYEKDVRGTRRLLDFAQTSNASHVLFTSSGAAYGQQPSAVTHIAEDDICAPATESVTTSYGQAKRASEFLCTLYASQYGLGVKVARGFAFVGPHLALDANFVIGNFLSDAVKGGPIVVKGDGTPYRSHLYAADLALWLWTILFRGAPGRIFNVGSERAMTIADLAKEVAAAVAPASEIRILQAPDESMLPQRYVPSTRRAFEELNLYQRIDLADALRRTARWHLQRLSHCS
jgi:nucleoside-diphosphate-sugar epimerase